MIQSIRLMDLLFFAMETHDNPKHVGALLIYEKPEDAGDSYMLDLVEKLRHSTVREPFNLTPEFPLIGLPYWKTVNHMEMEYHLRHSALPTPGKMEQLFEAVQRLHIGALDRSRPCWVCQVIEGLEGNRFALYLKVHHAYIDGKSAIKRIYGSMSTDPSDRRVTPIWGYKSPAKPDKQRTKTPPLTARLKGTFQALAKQKDTILDFNSAVLKMGLELTHLSKHTGRALFTAPRTRLNEHVDSDLRSIATFSLPIDIFKAICQKHQCKVNDLVLTLIDASLHDYLAQRGETPSKPLTAMIPMSVRADDDDSANTQVATLLLEMGEAGATLEQRLRKVALSATEAKEEARKMTPDALMDFVLMIGGTLEFLERFGLDAKISPSYNVLVSNVPGPSEDNFYLAGSKLISTYPISTLTPGTNLNVTVLSLGNYLDFGLLADHKAIEDIHSIAEGIEHHFRALEKDLENEAQL